MDSDEELIAEARARFELLRRQDRELDGNDIALIRAECSMTMAKAVVNLKGAAQWAAEYGERLCVALAKRPAPEAREWPTDQDVDTAVAAYDDDGERDGVCAYERPMRAALSSLPSPPVSK